MTSNASLEAHYGRLIKILELHYIRERTVIEAP